MLLLLATFTFSPPAAAGQYAEKAEFARVQSLVQQGRLGEAKTELLEELKRNPSSVDGYNLLGIIDSEGRDYRGALADFQRALRLDPNSTRTHNNLGDLYLTQKRTDLAEKEFRAALRFEPGNRDGNYNLGLLLMAQGRPSQAIPYFERVRPRDSATQLNLIRAYLQTKRTREALHVAAALSAEKKEDVKLHFSLGVLLASERQYQPAQIELEKADVLKPGDFAILLSLGHAYLLGGAYTKAEPELAQALTLKPESADTLYLLGQTYWKESRPLDALDKLVRAHAIAPKNTDVILLMAQVSIAEGYVQDAIPLLEKGIEIAPGRVDLRSALGESYFKSDKIDKAIETFQQVIAVQPSPRAFAFLGLSHAYLGRFDQAKQDFNNGLKLEPGNTFCLFNLGYIAEQQGDSLTAAAIFEKVLKADPNFPNALLSLASIRIQDRQFAEAERLLKRYIRIGRNPATGYYKLAMAERELHQSDAAARDLAKFQALSKDAEPRAYAYEGLFNYLDNRSRLSLRARNQQDLSELLVQIQKHPDQPEILYLLAQAYLRSGNAGAARSTITQLDKVKAGDYRTLAGAGVLFARYHLYDDALRQFQAALEASPDSDDVKFDLANAYFHKRLYSEALETSQQVSEPGRKDDAYLALLADIYAHTGRTTRAEETYQDAITHSPDNDQNYLSLALLQFREGNIADAKQTLLAGQARVPASGKILWGLGLVAVLEGNSSEAAKRFERAVDLLPEWPGGYSMLGVLYFQTGQIAKAREVLGRFKNTNERGALNVNRIEQILTTMPANAPQANGPLPEQTRENLLRFALTLADRTL